MVAWCYLAIVTAYGIAMAAYAGLYLFHGREEPLRSPPAIMERGYERPAQIWMVILTVPAAPVRDEDVGPLPHEGMEADREDA